jgi:hypothetical protein
MYFLFKILNQTIIHGKKISHYASTDRFGFAKIQK